MIKNTMSETRSNPATPFYEIPPELIAAHRPPVPGSSAKYSEDMLTRTYINWFWTVEDLQAFLDIPEIKEQSELRTKYDTQNFISFTRTVEFVPNEEYDRYLVENPPTN